jgi:hypothetical protein
LHAASSRAEQRLSSKLDEELGTWNLELGTWNLELGTWNLELGTWNLGLMYS